MGFDGFPVPVPDGGAKGKPGIIKNSMFGAGTMPVGASSHTFNVAGITDYTKAIVIITKSYSAFNAQNVQQLYGYMQSNTQVYVTNGGYTTGGQDTTFNYQIIEFEKSIIIQTGISGGTQTVNVSYFNTAETILFSNRITSYGSTNVTFLTLNNGGVRVLGSTQLQTQDPQGGTQSVKWWLVSEKA